MTKGIWAVLVAIAFVAGTITTGTMAYAASNAQGQPFEELDTRVTDLEEVTAPTNSFFDVFFDVFTVDSFFDLFKDKNGNTIDSFFDVFTEISVHNQDVQELKDQDQLTIENIGSSGQDGVQIPLPKGSLQSQIDDIDTRVSDLEEVRPPTRVGATDAFIKFDGIDGEAQDDKHKDWINLLSFSQGISTPTDPSTGQRVGKPIITLGVSVQLDKASPKIAEAAVNGKHFKQVDIHLTKTTDQGRVTYYAYELKNVFVTSYNVAGSGQAEEIPTASISLNFEEIKVTYTPVKKDGSTGGDVEYSWNVVEGKQP